MKRIVAFLFVLGTTLLFTACSTSNDVASNRGIQKRKYTKGFYIEKHDRNSGGIAETKVDSEDYTAVVEEIKNQADQYLDNEPVGITSSVEQMAFRQEINFELEQRKIDEKIENEEPIGLTKKQEFKQAFEKAYSTPLQLGRKKNVQVEDNAASSRGADTNTILLVILALFIPWLAVLLYEGATVRFWIDLLLWVLGWGFGWYIFGGGRAGLLSLIAVIYAILIVLGII